MEYVVSKFKEGDYIQRIHKDLSLINLLYVIKVDINIGEYYIDVLDNYNVKEKRWMPIEKIDKAFLLLKVFSTPLYKVMHRKQDEETN